MQLLQDKNTVCHYYQIVAFFIKAEIAKIPLNIVLKNVFKHFMYQLDQSMLLFKTWMSTPTRNSNL